MARDMAPACIDQCSHSCPAVGEAINAYMTRGGQRAAIRSVCKNKWAFACFVKSNHVGNCRVFFDKARRFGFSLPSSERELNGQCGRMLAANDSASEHIAAEAMAASVEEVAPKDAAIDAVTKESEQPSPILLEASVETASSACHRGYVKMARDMAPRCIDQCSHSCPAVGEAINAYMTRGGQSAAIRSVCKNKWAFSCFVKSNHVGNCRVFFDKARRFGFALPDSEGALNRQCGRMLTANDTAEEASLDSAKASAESVVDNVASSGDLHWVSSSSEAVVSSESKEPVVLTEVAVQATVETASSACQRGYVKMAYDMAPNCFDQCSSSCQSVGDTIRTFMTQGRDVAFGTVCENKWAFACFIKPEHIGACQVFFARAKIYGFELPTSESKLNGMCGLAEASTELKAPSLTALVSVQHAATSSDPCTQGSVKLVHDMASECVAQCPQSCPAIGAAIDAYFVGGLASARSAVCQHKNEFSCFVRPEHLEECRGFFATAAGFGVQLPSSNAELNSQCGGGRRLRGNLLV